MAKKETKHKQVLERTYNVPLRREWLKVARYMRAKKASIALRQFLARHMKGEVKIGLHLNKKLWEHGIKNPPHHIKVTAIKYDDGVVMAELVGHPVEPGKGNKHDKKMAEGRKGSKKEEKKPSGKEEKTPGLKDDNVVEAEIVRETEIPAKPKKAKVKEQ
jgi:ribosomal protein L31E